MNSQRLAELQQEYELVRQNRVTITEGPSYADLLREYRELAKLGRKAKKKARKRVLAQIEAKQQADKRFLARMRHVSGIMREVIGAINPKKEKE
jgi:hypothetical protein